MAFEKIIFWVEFPEELNWVKVEKLLSKVDLNICIYLAVKSRKQFEELEKEIKRFKHIKDIGVWPVLEKEKGYWFSGQTTKEDIDRLREYSGLKIKIDLEAPFKGGYNHFKMIWYSFIRMSRKAENSEYLEETIDWLCKNSEVELIANEFPFPKVMKRAGVYIDVRKYPNLDKNIMSYTSMAGALMRPFWKRVKNRMLKRAKKKYGDKLMTSVGLIGTGILGNEPVYKNPSQLKEDLNDVSKLGIKKVAIYSLEGVFRRKDPIKWLEVVKEFSKD